MLSLLFRMCYYLQFHYIASKTNLYVSNASFTSSEYDVIEKIEINSKATKVGYIAQIVLVRMKGAMKLRKASVWLKWKSDYMT